MTHIMGKPARIFGQGERAATSTMKDVLVIRPQMRDLWSIEDSCCGDLYNVHYADVDMDPSQPFDAVRYLDELARLPADAVVATHDNAALLAAIVAQRRGLRGPTPEAVFTCQFKPASRASQRVAAPQAVPGYAIFDPAAAFEPPFFLKPVFGTLSAGARRVDALSAVDVRDHVGYARRYAPIAGLMGLPAIEACGYLMEDLLSGDEATLEGYVVGGCLTTIAITDSAKYRHTDSFERFEYPTRLPAERQAEMIDIAARVVAEVGFDDGLLNLEFFVPERGAVKVVEVNPRIAAQYAPLVKALHGRSTYEVMFELACGVDPCWDSRTPDGVAISYCLRAFRDAFVERVPESQHGLEILVRPGQRLSEQGQNDPRSYRLAIFYEVAETRTEALLRCRERALALDFALV